MAQHITGWKLCSNKCEDACRISTKRVRRVKAEKEIQFHLCTRNTGDKFLLTKRTTKIFTGNAARTVLQQTDSYNSNSISPTKPSEFLSH